MGRLPDNVFIGVLMAIAVYPGSDLVENLFASRPQDFLAHGVYTCRFYVEGEWVEVITDTKIPCIRDQLSGAYLPVYSRSVHESEVWIQFAEKAYAKAVGNYESIQKTKIPEALLQLTGGSVQQVYLTNEHGEDLKDAWSILLGHINNDTMVLAIPSQEADEGTDIGSPVREDHELEGEGKEKDFIPGNLYSVVACKEIGGFGEIDQSHLIPV